MSPEGTFAYILNSLAWSLVGAGSVVLWCRLHTYEGKPVRIKLRRPNWLIVIATVILIFAVISSLVSASVDRRQRQFVACQAEVNQARSDALDELAQIGSQDRAALDQLVTDVTTATTREESLRALRTYQDTRAKLEADRKNHPLPRPDNLCGKPPTK